MLADAFQYENLSPERKGIIETARSYRGVRWRHQGRTRAAGLDCAGLLVRVGLDLGLLEPGYDVQGYRRTPDGKTLQEALERAAAQKTFDVVRPGDLVLMRGLDTKWPTHMGILSELMGKPYLIHSWVAAREVTETYFSDLWYDCAVGLYKFHGVPD